MGATNSTLHYQLSQFISTDKPAWLQDYNGDMQKIDTGINGALTAAESAQNSADSASSGVSTLNDAVSALSTTVSGHTSDITDLSGDVNTIESLIGNGTPTAGDHTLIGAINTNTGDIASLISASTWKFHDEKTGNTPISISGLTFNELLVVVKKPNVNSYQTQIIPKAMIDHINAQFYVTIGSGAAASYGTSFAVQYNSGSINLDSAFDGGSNITSTSQIAIYYR